MQAYGQGGNRALSLGRLANLARLYWYTIEFGLIRTAPGCASSAPASCRRSVKASSRSRASPNRIAFNLERVMRTKDVIDDFQQTYFVVDRFERMLQECYRDSVRCRADESGLRHRARRIGRRDKVISRGTLDYFINRGSAAPAVAG